MTKRVLVFDYDLWGPLRDCPVHKKNECFFLPATVLRRYSEDGENLILVRFDHWNQDSLHFEHAVFDEEVR